VEFAGAMVVAMLVDAVLGWPDGVFARIGHPVTWLGQVIGALDARWNRSEDSALDAPRRRRRRRLDRDCAVERPRARGAGCDAPGLEPAHPARDFGLAICRVTLVA